MDCGLDSVDQRPSDYPSQVSAQVDWLSDLAHRLVDLVWMAPPQEDINAAAAATAGRCDGEKKKISPFCYCREEKAGERLVRCCSNLCPGLWFHEGCARARAAFDPRQDWFCGPDCRADGTYVYCHCKEQRGGQMVQCGRMDKCGRHEWYHRACLTAAERNRAEQSAMEFGKGSFTRQQVEQSAQLAGAQAQHLDRLFFTGGNPLNLSTYLSRLTSSSCRRPEDVSRFVEEFRRDELFGFKPGRAHQDFHGFRYQRRVKSPERMGRRLRSLSEELDRRRDKVL